MKLTRAYLTWPAPVAEAQPTWPAHRGQGRLLPPARRQRRRQPRRRGVPRRQLPAWLPPRRPGLPPHRHATPRAVWLSLSLPRTLSPPLFLSHTATELSRRHRRHSSWPPTSPRPAIPPTSSASLPRTSTPNYTTPDALKPRRRALLLCMAAGDRHCRPSPPSLPRGHRAARLTRRELLLRPPLSPCSIAPRSRRSHRAREPSASGHGAAVV